VVDNVVSVNYARGASFSTGNNRIEARKLPLWVFCRNLERYSDRQIIDMPGLTGAYDFTVNVTPEDYQAMMLRFALLRGPNLPPEAQKFLDSNPAAALGDALGQVGLKLESRKAPLDTIVIDSALKTPTANQARDFRRSRTRTQGTLPPLRRAVPPGDIAPRHARAAHRLFSLSPAHALLCRPVFGKSIVDYHRS
jgi:hypothetical protein